MKPGTVVLVTYHHWFRWPTQKLGIVRFFDPVRDVARVDVVVHENFFNDSWFTTNSIVVPLKRLQKVEDQRSTSCLNFWADVRSGLHDFAFTHKQSDKTPVT